MAPSNVSTQPPHLPEPAAVLLRPLRIRILEALGEPNSASGLARRLGTSRQKINYHLRELEKKALVKLVEERRKGNCVERVVRATTRSYLLTAEALGNLAFDPEEAQDRFSATYLTVVAARAIRDLAALRNRAGKANKRLATFAMETEIRFASAGDRARFTEELANQVARLTAKYHDDKSSGGRRFRYFFGAYPSITKTQGGNSPATGKDQEGP